MSEANATRKSGLFASPIQTPLIALIWLLSNNSLDPGHIVLGLVFGLLLPAVTRSFWPEAPRLVRLAPAGRLLAIFVYDLIVANFRVARLVLGPNERLSPGFIEVPLDLENPFAIGILASMLTLTPGTLSCQVRNRVLVVHALELDDVDALILEIKQRYERPLREALEC